MTNLAAVKSSRVILHVPDKTKRPGAQPVLPHVAVKARNPERHLYGGLYRIFTIAETGKVTFPPEPPILGLVVLGPRNPMAGRR
jgi:hypothetical protein